MTRPQKPKNDPPQKRSKKPTLFLTIAAAALLVGGGAATLAYFLTRGAAPSDLPVGVNVVPQDALMVVSLTTDGEQWNQLRRFGTPQSQKVFDQSLAQLRDRLLTANSLDYEQDVKPWVGDEVTFAFFNRANSAATPGGPPAALPSPAPGASPNLLPPLPTPQNTQATLIVLPIRDALKAKVILEKPRTQSNPLTERTYQGITIWETQQQGQTVSLAVLDNRLLLVANDAKAMERAIDTHQGGAALAVLPGYRQALAKIQSGPSFGRLYVNLPAAAATSPGRTNPQAIAAQQLQGLASTINLESEGVRFKSVYWLRPDSDRRHIVRNNARDIASRLPGDTLLMVSGGSFQQFWQDYSRGSAVNPFLPLNPQALEQGIQQTVGMDLQKDFLAWMDGEFSLALVGTPQNPPQTVPYSFVIMVKASDRRTAEASFKKLDQAMAERYKLKVEESKVANQSVVNWSLPLAGPTITHGWLDGDVAFLSLGAPLAPSLIPRPAENLAESETFKRTVPRELTPNNGHFFVDIERAITAKSLPLLQIPPGNRDLFAAIRSLGVTAAYSDDRTIRFDVFTALQKSEATPGPLPAPTPPAPGAGARPGSALPEASPEATPAN